MVHVISLPEMERMGARQLLALRDRLLACEESLAQSDKASSELTAECIYFKDDPRWREMYSRVLSLLNTREHLPGGDERRAQRQARAARTQQSERRHGRRKPG
jgi:hypothetical protein